MKPSVMLVKQAPEFMAEAPGAPSTYCKVTVSKAHTYGRKLASTAAKKVHKVSGRSYQIPGTAYRRTGRNFRIKSEIPKVAVRSHYVGAA